MSVETVKISITKQILLGLLGLVIILLAIEILSYVILDQRDSCNQSLPMSGLYEQLDVNELKKICQDYKSIIQYPLPIIHYEPNHKHTTVSVKVKISARLVRLRSPLSLAPIRDFALLRSGTAVYSNLFDLQ